MSDVTLTQAELQAKIDEASKSAVEAFETNVSNPRIARLEAKNSELLNDLKASKEKGEAFKGFSAEALKMIGDPTNQDLFKKIEMLEPKTLGQAIDLAKRLKDNGEINEDTKDISALIKAEIAPIQTAHEAQIKALTEEKEKSEKEALDIRSELHRNQITNAATTAFISEKAIPEAASDFVHSQILAGKIRVNAENNEIEILDDKGEVLKSTDAKEYGQPMKLSDYAKTLRETKPYLFGQTTGTKNLKGGHEGGNLGAEFDPYAKDVDVVKLAEWESANPELYKKAVEEGRL